MRKKNDTMCFLMAKSTQSMLLCEQASEMQKKFDF